MATSENDCRSGSRTQDSGASVTAECLTPGKYFSFFLLVLLKKNMITY